MLASNLTYDKFTITNETISINSFDIHVPGKQLFKNATLQLCPGKKYGLLGSNGSGKTTLLLNLLQLRNQDNQDSQNNNKIYTLYVDQEIKLDQRNPVDFILDSNYKQNNIQKMIDEINNLLEGDTLEDDEIESYQQKMIDLSDIISNWCSEKEQGSIIKILLGLGFSSSDLTKESHLFSGGWQMRISLARSLYLDPDLLLLDEPTNHLDLEATIWLTDYLENWKHTAIIISHNIGFINDVCDYILNIENQKLSMYKGNYTLFKKAYNIKLTTAEKEWETYNKKIQALKKKGNKKETDEYIKKNHIERPPKPFDGIINFGDPDLLKSNLIKMTNVSFGYEELILSNIDFGIDMNSRIVLVGPNGSGKSTFVKLLSGEIKPVTGEINYHQQLNIAYYNQHFDSQLPLEKTPIEYLDSIIPKDLVKNGNSDQTIRSFLGKVRLESSAHLKKIGDLSGGQKARVAIVKLIFKQPNCLILDEPTNHLDLETVESLIDGLVDFKGCILVITHDHNLIEQINANIVMMDPVNKKIKNIESYKAYCDSILSV
jgi:ATP-binding cassette subfamily F protein 1